jgi:hypothetical protein
MATTTDLSEKFMDESTLVRKFDAYIPQILDRLQFPSQERSILGLFKPKVKNKAVTSCINKLGELYLAIILRQTIKFPLDTTPDVTTTENYGNLLTLLQENVKGLESINFPTNKIYQDSYNILLFLHFAQLGLDKLTSEECNTYSRIEHFNKNLINNQKGTLQLDNWKTSLKLYHEKKDIYIQQESRFLERTIGTDVKLSLNFRKFDNKVFRKRYDILNTLFLRNGISPSHIVIWLGSKPQIESATTGGGGPSASASISAPVMAGGSRKTRRNRRGRKTLNGMHKAPKARKTNKSRKNRRHQ